MFCPLGRGKSVLSPARASQGLSTGRSKETLQNTPLESRICKKSATKPDDTATHIESHLEGMRGHSIHVSAV